MALQPAPLEEIGTLLRHAHSVAVLTGAGVSAESGVPTFRDAQAGLWAQFDPEELATPRAFARNPGFVWAWYAWRRELIGQARPNPAHAALAALEARVLAGHTGSAKPEATTAIGPGEPLSSESARRAPSDPQSRAFTLVTQNVDGLHAAAGSRNIVELHGNIMRVRCSRACGVVATWDPPAPDEPPRCGQCGAFLRPDVVWFEEMLPPDALARAEDAVTHCDVLLVVGTAAEVYPAAALPSWAQRAGARVVEVNPNATALSTSADYVLRGAAGVVLPALVATAWPDSAA